MRKAVLYAKNFNSTDSIGSYGGSRSIFNTVKTSQAGKRLRVRASWREAPFIISLNRGSSEKERRPNCFKVVLIADLCPLTAEADNFFTLDKKAK